MGISNYEMGILKETDMKNLATFPQSGKHNM